MAQRKSIVPETARFCMVGSQYIEQARIEERLHDQAPVLAYGHGIWVDWGHGNAHGIGIRPPIPIGSNGADCAPASPLKPGVKLLSIVMPACDEEGCIASTVEHLHLELQLNHIAHEIIAVDDGSADGTAAILTALGEHIPEVRLVPNGPPHGFGRAIACGLQRMSGDAAVIMMADESDDCRDVVRYWNALDEGWDLVFGSRFMKGGGVIDYSWPKLGLNRMANL